MCIDWTNSSAFDYVGQTARADPSYKYFGF